MKKKPLTFFLFFFLPMMVWTQSASITNIQVNQRTDGSGLVDVYFTLDGTAASYFVNMQVSFDAGLIYNPVTFYSMSGNVGPTSPGNNKHIVWNPAMDHPNRYSPQTKLKIVAYIAGISNTCPGQSMVSDIDGNVYFTIQFGSQCWIASNLNTTRNAAGDQITRNCYGNDNAWCEQYGGLYTWATAMDGATSGNNPSGVQGICPNGWHLPSDAELTQLTDYLINNYVDITADNVGNKLKSCRQLNSPLGGECMVDVDPLWQENSIDYGTNDFGFSAFPGGFYGGGGSAGINIDGYWWSSTEESSTTAWARGIYYHIGSVDRHINAKVNGFSVRCLRD